MKVRVPRPRADGAPLPWDPLRDLMGLKDRVNRLLEAILRKGDFSALPAFFRPPVDLREDRDAFVLTSEVPGVRREDLAIRVEGGIVTLEGRRPLEEETRRSALRIERAYGSFSRTVHLPGPVDEQRVRARLHLGVLEIILPKSSGTRARSIKVRVEP